MITLSACFLGDRKDLPLAREIAEQLKGPTVENYPIWNHLIMKNRMLAEEDDEADRLRALLLKGTGRPGYIQFRYAQKRGFE